MTLATSPLDVEKVRKDFPALDRLVHDDRQLVYLDNAATSQKPRQVLDALDDYYTRHNANVHRGLHVLAEEATALYEGARDKVAAFVNAADRAEVVFTKNSTEALNLAANVIAWADHSSPRERGLRPGDEVVITEMEHHSNIVPWQMVTQRSGATLRWFGLTDEGRLDLSDIDRVITERTKVVSFVLVSNILGTVNPPEELVRRAHEVGALVVVDASQAAPHMPLDVQALGADLVAFTGHKMCGPTGIGVLWGRKELLEELPPFLGGGEMIEAVTMATSTYAELPHKYEAGTPPIAQAVGLGAAVDYLSGLGMDAVHAHEQQITAYALDRLQQVEGLRIIGPATPVARGAAVSFALGDLHPHDVGQVLDELGIAVRVGHHCARPVCLRYAVPATTRASFYLYSTTGEVDALVDGLEHVKRFFGGPGGRLWKLESMYQEIILDHYRKPHHKGLREPFDAEVHHVNPTCGDEVTLRVKVDQAGDGSTVVTDVSYDSLGCSISQASVSVMTDLVVGKDLAEATTAYDAFLALMRTKGDTDAVIERDEDVLEDAVAFEGVSKYPARIKCALLGWMAWKDATAQAVGQGMTTEETA